MHVGLITYGQPVSDAFSKLLICFKSTDGSMNAWNRCRVFEQGEEEPVRSHVYTSNRTVIDPVHGYNSWRTSTALHLVPLNFYDFREFYLSPFFLFIESRFRIVPAPRKGVEFLFSFERRGSFFDSNESGFWTNNYRLYFYVIGGEGGYRTAKWWIIFRY